MDFTSVPQSVMVLVRLPNMDREQQQLFIPACATAISASILLLRFLLTFKPGNDFLARVGILDAPTEKVPRGIGQGRIRWFRLARLLGCLGLLVLSILSSDYE
jgi:hypothetical protein